MAKFVCTTRCFHGQILYNKGDTARFTKAEDGPKNHDGELIHFVCTEPDPEPEKIKDDLEDEPEDDLEECEWCGEEFKNVGAHQRFCKSKPTEVD